MYFDSVFNVLSHGIGVILISLEDYHCPFMAELNFSCTNNVTKYEARVMGFQAAIDKKVMGFQACVTDSTLIIYQLKCKWETRDSKLIPYYEFITELIK